MSQSGCLLPKLLLYIVAVAELPCWCQTAVLKGRISDPLQKKPIPGAEVILLGIDGKQQGKTMSGADGLYSINQLKRGQRVSARYRRGGYAPDPRTYDIVLSQVENVNDVELLRDTSDASYWGAWSGAIKSFVDGQAADP